MFLSFHVVIVKDSLRRRIIYYYSSPVSFLIWYVNIYDETKKARPLFPLPLQILLLLAFRFN